MPGPFSVFIPIKLFLEHGDGFKVGSIECELLVSFVCLFFKSEEGHLCFSLY